MAKKNPATRDFFYKVGMEELISECKLTTNFTTWIKCSM